MYCVAHLYQYEQNSSVMFSLLSGRLVLCVAIEQELLVHTFLTENRSTLGPAYYRPQRSCGQGNIFTPVCHSVHRGGVCSGGVSATGGSGPRGVSAPGGVWSPGGGGWGCLLLGGLVPGGSGPGGWGLVPGGCLLWGDLVLGGVCPPKIKKIFFFTLGIPPPPRS